MRFLIVLLSYFALCNSLIYSQQKDSTEAWQLEQKAIELYKTFKYDSAANYYFKAAKIYEQQEDWLKTVKNYRLTANTLNHTIKSDTALFFIRKALNIADKNFIMNTKSEAFEKADIYITYGNIHKKIYNYSEGFLFYENALTLVFQTDSTEKLKVAEIWKCIGALYLYKGDYEIALTYLKKSTHIKTQTLRENHPNLAVSYYGLGLLYHCLGDYFKASEYYHKVIQMNSNWKNNYTLLRNLNYESINSLIGSYHYLSVLYQYKDDYDKAFEHSQNALKMSTLIYGEDHLIVGYCYNNLGIYYNIKKDYEKSIKYFTKALKIMNPNSTENLTTVAKIYNDMGMCYSNNGDHNKAIEYYQKALKIKKRTYDKHHPNLAYGYINVALENDIKNDFKKALEYYQKALMVNVVDFNDTNVYHNPKKLNAFSKPALLETLRGKAKSLHSFYKSSDIFTKNIKVSVFTYELAFNLITEIRNDYSNENMKLLISEENKKYFNDAIHATLELNKADPCIDNKEKTFEFIEKSKSATLGSYLNELELKQYSNITDTLLNKEKKIAINRNEYETKIQKTKAQKDGYDTLLVGNYQDSLFYFSRQYDNLMNTLKHNYPEYFSLKYKQETAEIEDIQHEMDNNSALINYFIGDTSLFICSITKEGYTIKAIKTDSLFNEKLIDYYIDIKFGFTEKELKSSTYLYNYLIEPIEGDLKGKNKLIIIPDGNLYYIPFETLCKNDTYTEDLSKLNYLIKDYSVTYHHTATLWLSSKEKVQNGLATKDNFIGFAPVFNPKINNGFIVSNEWIQDTTNTGLASRSISNDLTHFNALPYSENEVESIVKLFNKKRKNAKGFFYKEANEENFKQNIKYYKYIHIASHSFTNDLYPNLSGIAFSQPDTSSRYKEDGILYAGETYNLNLPNADLITLSSCKSGLGKLIQGEGFLSLSRGFLYSGTPNIIFSLWNVKDEPTKDLMVDFYKQVLQGTAYANALRKSKLKLISNPETASPKYWGAWMLVGR